MKVAFAAPYSISAVNGGLRRQALNTIEVLKEKGVEAFLLSPWTPLEDIKPDLVHIFGASVENTGLAARLHEKGIPYVVSPVFFSNRKAWTIKAAINLEMLSEFFGAGFRSDFNQKALICQRAAYVLPNTDEEARLVEESFSVSPLNIRIVPNAVENRFEQPTAGLFESKYGVKDFVLFAGQAGAPRKRVLDLIEAAPEINAPVVIIGSFNRDNYGEECIRKAATADNIILIDTLPHESELLASAYAAAKVFALPSDFETPGIAAMEAALAGCNIVITSVGGTREYFRDKAFYIEPGNRSQLISALQNALKRDADTALKEHILREFNWDIVAEKTMEVYRELCS